MHGASLLHSKLYLKVKSQKLRKRKCYKIGNIKEQEAMESLAFHDKIISKALKFCKSAANCTSFHWNHLKTHLRFGQFLKSEGMNQERISVTPIYLGYKSSKR